MALTDVLSNGVVVKKNSNIELYVNDLLVFNIFSKNYLPKWKNQNWISATGKPIAYVDILCPLLQVIQEQQLKFQTHWIRVIDQTCANNADHVEPST